MIPVADLTALTDEARAVSAGLTRDRLLRRPAGGGWCVAECFDHVNATNRLYVSKIGNALADARARGLTGSGPFRLGPLERAFVWVVGPPPRLKVKAPDPFLPAPRIDPEAAVAEWESLHRSLLGLAADASGLHLGKVKVASPVNASIRISLLAAFHLIVAHDRRHLWQVKQMVDRGEV